jgi:hypothetical protein
VPSLLKPFCLGTRNFFSLTNTRGRVIRDRRERKISRPFPFGFRDVSRNRLMCHLTHTPAHSEDQESASVLWSPTPPALDPAEVQRVGVKCDRRKARQIIDHAPTSLQPRDALTSVGANSPLPTPLLGPGLWDRNCMATLQGLKSTRVSEFVDAQMRQDIPTNKGAFS